MWLYEGSDRLVEIQTTGSFWVNFVNTNIFFFNEKRLFCFVWVV